jgi:hypothetical protein
MLILTLVAAAILSIWIFWPLPRRYRGWLKEKRDREDRQTER